MKDVLLIDDDSVFNLLNTRLLKSTGEVSDIHTALNGEQAIDLLNNYYMGAAALPDLILLDLNMPVMDGFEFLQAFRQLPIPNKEQVKTVIVTSSQDPKDIQRAAEMGIKHFLTKPVSEKQLRQVLEEN